MSFLVNTSSTSLHHGATCICSLRLSGFPSHHISLESIDNSSCWDIFCTAVCRFGSLEAIAVFWILESTKIGKTRKVFSSLLQNFLLDNRCLTGVEGRPPICPWSSGSSTWMHHGFFSMAAGSTQRLCGIGTADGSVDMPKQALFWSRIATNPTKCQKGKQGESAKNPDGRQTENGNQLRTFGRHSLPMSNSSFNSNPLHRQETGPLQVVLVLALRLLEAGDPLCKQLPGWALSLVTWHAIHQAFDSYIGRKG